MKHLRNLTAAAALPLASAIFASAVFASATPASAQDTLKMTIGQRGNWDTAITQLGTKAGIFKKHGLELEMVYTSGSGETLQPVIGGAVELGLAVGTLGAIAAYAKGAPVRPIGNLMTGATDLFWYLKADSPIRTMAASSIHRPQAGATKKSSWSRLETEWARVSTGGMAGDTGVTWCVPTPAAVAPMSTMRSRYLSAGILPVSTS